MERPWTSEYVVDAPLARKLIDDQFPSLSPASTVRLGAGWDNTVYLVNDRLVFRFPRRGIAVDLLRTEIACLPSLATQLPVSIPVPIYAGQPSREYPWPFAGYPYLKGEPASHLALDLGQRRRLAGPLAAFLKALHAVPAASMPPGGLPPDTWSRLDARRRLPATEERLAFVASRGVAMDRNRILNVLESTPPPPPISDLVVVHGDLHAGQLLLDERSDLAGVIDWGDLHQGLAGVDFAVVHQLMPAAFHDGFLTAYGDVDPATWKLAKSRAVWHAVALLANAVDVGDDRLVREWNTALTYAS
jgi:aminoglycoside phosphotransferase (APT) family kinase protein